MAAACSSAKEAVVPPPTPVVQTQWHLVHSNTVTPVQLVPLHHRATWVNDWVPPDSHQPINRFLVSTPGTSSQPLISQKAQGKEFVTRAQLEGFEKQLTSKLERKLNRELVQYKKELQIDFKEMQKKGFGELLVSVGNTVRDELKRNGIGNRRRRSLVGANFSENRFNSENFGKRRRTEDGRPICFKCRHPGHLARNCGNQGRLHQQSANATNESLPKN